MSYIDNMLARLEDESNQMYSYESEMYDENYKGRGPMRGRGLVKRAPLATNSPVMRPSRLVPKAKAQFDVNIKRLTSTLPQSLEVIVFGAGDINSGYNGVVNVPAGLTLSVLGGGQDVNNPSRYDKKVFRYTNGVDTDDIELTCNQYPYPSLVYDTTVDVFRINTVRYSISDVTKTQQFGNRFDWIKRTIFGKLDRQSLSVNSFKSPEQFQAGIIDLSVDFAISKEYMFNVAILPEANFQVTLSIFVEVFDKLDYANEIR